MPPEDLPPEPPPTEWDPPPPPEWHKDLLTVGVTGTNGKTSTTTWVACALARLKTPVARATTLGLFVGDKALDLPLTYEAFVETMRRCHERGGAYAAIELTSEALARGFARSWPCKVGVFTNLTHDHLDAHGTFEHYLASKAQLFLQLPEDGTAVLNGCDEACDLLLDVVPQGVRTLWYGVPSRGAPRRALDVRASHVELGWKGTEVKIETSAALGREAGEVTVLATRAIGDVFAENLLAAWTAAITAGVPPREAAKAIAEAPIPAGRFEPVADAPHVVVDYAHTPDALARTLRAARTLCRGQLVVVFGAGGNRDRKKRAPMGAAACLADRVWLTSDNPRDEDPRAIADAIRAGLADHPGVEVELDRARAIGRALAGCGPEDVVVIAGKGHEVEQVAQGARRPLSDAQIVRAALGLS